MNPSGKCTTKSANEQRKKETGSDDSLICEKKVKSGREVVVEEKEDKQDDPLDVWSSYTTNFFYR